MLRAAKESNSLRFWAMLPLIGCHALPAQNLSGELIYERCSGAIVQVGVKDDLGRIRSSGSGIVLKDSAWLVTNYHIFEQGGYLVAEKDGEPIDITGGIVRADAERDVLILKVNSFSFPETWKRIPDLEVARYGGLKRGQQVYAIGNPAGLENTITDGLLSGLRTAEDTAFKLLQISAPISPGSSGGGIFDGRGRLIGMSTFVMRPRTAQNLNFALPVDEILFWDRSATRHDINESKWDRHYEQGLEYWKMHDCLGAVSQFRRVPDNSPQKGRALYYTARCLHQGKDLKQAKEGYERALAADPRIARAHAFLASILFTEGDTANAVDHQMKAYRLDPSLIDAKVAVDDW